MEYSVTKKILTRTEVASLDKLKEASYKNRWLGIPARFFAGMGLGFMVSAIIVE
ncbi:MAG: hypothetical protein ACYCVH_09535 [Ignavibacteriaceae bacterium]